VPFVVTCGVISAVVVVVVQWRIRRFPGTTGGLVGCDGPPLVYLSTLSLGGDASIE